MWKLRALSKDTIYIQTGDAAALLIRTLKPSNPSEWRFIARLIEAAPEMLEVLEAIRTQEPRVDELLERVKG